MVKKSSKSRYNIGDLITISEELRSITSDSEPPLLGIVFGVRESGNFDMHEYQILWQDPGENMSSEEQWYPEMFLQGVKK